MTSNIFATATLLLSLFLCSVLPSLSPVGAVEATIISSPSMVKIDRGSLRTHSINNNNSDNSSSNNNRKLNQLSNRLLKSTNDLSMRVGLAQTSHGRRRDQTISPSFFQCVLESFEFRESNTTSVTEELTQVGGVASCVETSTTSLDCNVQFEEEDVTEHHDACILIGGTPVEFDPLRVDCSVQFVGGPGGLPSTASATFTYSSLVFCYPHEDQNCEDHSDPALFCPNFADVFAILHSETIMDDDIISSAVCQVSPGFDQCSVGDGSPGNDGDAVAGTGGIGSQREDDNEFINNPSSSTSSQSSMSSSSPDSLSVGAIIGVVAGIMIVMAILLLLVYRLGRRRGIATKEVSSSPSSSGLQMEAEDQPEQLHSQGSMQSRSSTRDENEIVSSSAMANSMSGESSSLPDGLDVLT